METEHPVMSLLDDDFYKLTMGQFIWRRYQGTLVCSAFMNRTTSVRLANTIPEHVVRQEVEALSELRFTNDDIDYLATIEKDGVRILQDDYLAFLKTARIPRCTIEVRDGQYDIRCAGPWELQTFAEMPVLSTLNELYGRVYEKIHGKTDSWIEGQRRLDAKIERLNQYPGIRLIEFGTRRRYSREWQRHVLRELRDRLRAGMLLGTSNVLLAKELNLQPLGTMAHELFMVIAALNAQCDSALRASHSWVMDEWFEEYGPALAILLTDTFTTDFCFDSMTEKQMLQWRGFRQDSREPIRYGRDIIAQCERFGIDPRSKLVVFSDGLDVETMVKILTHYQDAFNVSYGWGTNATNDVGIPTLSLVMKPVLAGGRSTVKLSDNVAKAMGEERERYMRVFHSVTDYQELHS